MVHVLQHPQLPVGPLGVDGTLEGPGQLLDGHLVERALVEEGVIGTADLTVGPATDGHQVGVTLRHFPDGLVQLHAVESFLHDWCESAKLLASESENNG